MVSLNRLILTVMRTLVFLSILSQCYCQLIGPNTCTKKETFVEEVLVSELQPYQVREFSFCLSATLRCSKIVTKFRTIFKTQRLVKIKPVLKCCEGFKEDLSKRYCIPRCSKGCDQGKCVTPEVCQCFSGYGGPTCNFLCPLGFYGENCEYACLCKNGANCDALNGKCTCLDGYTGKYCDDHCKADSYGKDCREVCKCSHGDCHHVTGNCSCHAGWEGPLCDSLMQDFNINKKECSCVNGGSCTSNTCQCIEGWYGTRCEKKCTCLNGGSCSQVTEKCICLPGFSGHNCSDECAHETFGQDCAYTCQCANGKCSKIDGSCTCFGEWSGMACNISLSPHMAASLNCQCPNENFICNADKSCVCRNGYDGENCETSTINRWLLFGGISVAIFVVIIIIAVVTNCIFLVQSNKKPNIIYLENRRFLNPNNTRPSSCQETELNNEDFYVKKKDLYKEHFYEVVDNPSSYDTLTFNGTIRPQSQHYQIVRNNLINKNKLNQNYCK